MQVFQTQPNTRMSKASGNTRLLTPKQRQIDKARNEYNQIVSSSLVDASLSYFSEQTGAHAIFMKGHNHTDKIADAEAELEVARAIADNGINVTLTPEGGKYTMYATNVKINKDGLKKYKFAEGLMATYTYEQKTPTEINSSAESSVRLAINHANDKHAQIALIYDKHSLFHTKDIENGMKLYQSRHKAWKTKGVKAVVVISSKKILYEHHFDE